ncbi:MAG: amidohydrolase family protein, partial [Actinobacteria bacterium]|nr:amidohydrolase family protein [Actinomycetota bacterium]
MTIALDCDSHLSETRTTWSDHIDPKFRDDALTLEDDDLGWTWLTWRGKQLGLAEVQFPRQPESIGEGRKRLAAGLPPEVHYDELLPRDHWDPRVRADTIAGFGLDASVVFPNFGLGWESELAEDPPVLMANLRAANRWMANAVDEGQGRLLGVGHINLHDPAWAEQEIANLAAAGIRLAMTAPAIANGRRLSHPDHDRVWAAFVDHGVTPVFHVADQARVFDDCWFDDDPTGESLVQAVDSVFLWVPPALALTDLILSGVFDRYPDLRVGVVELSSIWVPQFLLMLDGAYDFTTKLNGRPSVELATRPSAQFLDRVRVSSF